MKTKCKELNICIDANYKDPANDISFDDAIYIEKHRYQLLSDIFLTIGKVCTLIQYLRYVESVESVYLDLEPKDHPEAEFLWDDIQVVRSVKNIIAQHKSQKETDSSM